MFWKDWKKEIVTIPNLLSIIRLILIPVYISIYINAKQPADYYLAAAILAVSCLTDLIDGKIARHFNMISNLGKILDPLADKATQFSLILCLATKHPILWILIILFVVKEGFQVIAGAINLRKGIMLKGALLSGKVCTTVLFLTLILMIMIPNLPEIVIFLLTVLDLSFMTLSFVDYLITYKNKTNCFQSLDNGETQL